MSELITKGFQELLNLLRVKRNFDAHNFLDLKLARINNFFRENNLDSAVVGISGGIDSALVFALLSKASELENSLIKKIVPVLMPIRGEGTTGQTEALKQGKELIARFGKSDVIIRSIHYVQADLTSVLMKYLQADFSYKNNAWAIGQLASMIRTPYLYYQAALLQTEGFKSIVVGTTNRDEGAYIGFFGKASDGMVDLQPIADIHKSEVVAVAKLLNIPDSIINAVPKGDVYDGKSDEEMIGAPYWFLELYQLWLCDEPNLEYLPESLNDEEKHQFEIWQKNIETLRVKNIHKYQVGSPAHYIDVLQRKVETC